MGLPGIAGADGVSRRFEPAACAPRIRHPTQGLCTQNGLAWSPDGRTMHLSDSHPPTRLIRAFDYDIDDGVPPRRFAGSLLAALRRLPCAFAAARDPAAAAACDALASGRELDARAGMPRKLAANW